MTGTKCRDCGKWLEVALLAGETAPMCQCENWFAAPESALEYWAEKDI